MENASKALLIAAGIIFAMLTLSLLVLGWNKISEFRASQDTLNDIADIAKFNEQFSQYDRDNISGYELISLANKVADYNTRYSYAEGQKNSEGREPIKIEINLVKKEYIQGLYYDDAGKNNRLFNEMVLNLKNYSDENDSKTINSKNSLIDKIIGEATVIEDLFGGVIPATAVARNISILDFDSRMSGKDYETDLLFKGKKYSDFSQSSSEAKAIRKIFSDRYKTYANIDVRYDTQTNFDIDRLEFFGEKGLKMYKYYEYYQFKKAKFKCTGIKNDNMDGRVSKLSFEWVDGKIE